MNKGINIDNNKICTDHLFSLSPLRPSCYFQKVITSQFCRNGGQKDKYQGKRKKINSKKKIQKQPCISLNLPTFNKDNNYGSPGFSLSSEKTYYIRNFERILYEHQRHVQNIERNNVQMCIPKPGSKSNFCSVCKQQYEEYINHIGCESHKKKIKVNKFNDYISELEGLMRKQNPLNSKNSYETIAPNSNSEKSSGHLLYTNTAEQHLWNQYNRQLYDKAEQKMMGSNPRKMIKMDPSYHMPMPSYNFQNPNQNHIINRQNFITWQQNANANFHANSDQKQIQAQKIEFPRINLNQTQNFMTPHYINYNLHMNLVNNHQNLTNPLNCSLNDMNATNRYSSFQNQNSYNHNYQCHQNILPPPNFYPLMPPKLPYTSYFNQNHQPIQNLQLNCLVDPLINWNAQILMHQMVSTFHTIQNLQRIQMQINNRFTINMDPNLNEPNYSMQLFNTKLNSEDAIPEHIMGKSREKDEKRNSCQKQDVFQRQIRARPQFQGNIHRATRNCRRKLEKSQNYIQKYTGTLNHDFGNKVCEGRERRQLRERSIIMEQEYQNYEE